MDIFQHLILEFKSDLLESMNIGLLIVGENPFCWSGVNVDYAFLAIFAN